MRIKRFRGEEELRIDSKGRVSVPANFRRVLESQDPDWSEGKSVQMTVVYGSHLSDCVECYSVDTMAEVEAWIDALPYSGARSQAMTRMFLTESLDFSIDDTGRIVLPAKLRAKIGVEAGAPVYFVGTGKSFQIWNPVAYARQVTAQEAELEEGSDESFDPRAVLDQQRRLAAAAEREV